MPRQRGYGQRRRTTSEMSSEVSTASPALPTKDVFTGLLAVDTTSRYRPHTYFIDRSGKYRPHHNSVFCRYFFLITTLAVDAVDTLCTFLQSYNYSVIQRSKLPNNRHFISPTLQN